MGLVCFALIDSYLPGAGLATAVKKAIQSSATRHIGPKAAVAGGHAANAPPSCAHVRLQPNVVQFACARGRRPRHRGNPASATVGTQPNSGARSLVGLGHRVHEPGARATDGTRKWRHKIKNLCPTGPTTPRGSKPQHKAATAIQAQRQQQRALQDKERVQRGTTIRVIGNHHPTRRRG